MLTRKRPFTIKFRPAMFVLGLALSSMLLPTCPVALAADSSAQTTTKPAAAQGPGDTTQGTSMSTDTPPSETDNTGLQAEESDPLEPFNSAMFTFNLKVDDYVLHPVASGYAKVIPQGG